MATVIAMKPPSPRTSRSRQRVLADVADRIAVDVDQADLDAPGDRGLAVDQVDDHAVLGEHHPRPPAPRSRTASARVGPQVPPLAVHRHDVVRPHRVVEEQQLAGGGVPGHVHLRDALVHDRGAEPGQPVDHREHAGLVARDHRGGQDHRVPGPDPHCRWSPRAIRDSADSGSPCEPVEMSSTWSGGSVSALSEATSRPSGTVEQPEILRRSACCAPSTGRRRRPCGRARPRRRASAAPGARGWRRRRR